MTLYELIERASVGPITETMVLKSAADLQIPVEQLFDEFAKSVAEKYADGEFSWEFGDIAMNNLFCYAYPSSGEGGLSSFAFRVFEAFDQGEYVHKGTPPEENGEPRTKALLAPLLAASKAK